MFQILAAKEIPYKFAQCRVGTNSDEDVEKELVNLNVSHVVCVTGRTHGPGCPTIEYLEGGPDRVYQNVRDNMYRYNLIH